MKNNLNVFLVDDHSTYRKALKSILSRLPGIQVIGEAGNGQDFLDQCSEFHPDLVLMDVVMPVLDGAQATLRAKKLQPELKIIALSMFENLHYFKSMMEAGADGFLLKDSFRSEFKEAFSMVMTGKYYYSAQMTLLVNQIKINN